MKPFDFRWVLLLLSCIAFLSGSAENSFSYADLYGMTERSGNNKIITLTPHNVSKRPKADYVQQIYCEYDNGNLYVSFTVPEGTCALLLTEFDTGFTYRYVFDTEDDAVIYVGELSSAYLLFETSRGYVYEGRMD